MNVVETNPQHRTSGRHRPHSRLNNWHTIDYDQEMVLELSYCNKAMKDVSLLVDNVPSLGSEMFLEAIRTCSTSTPLRSPIYDEKFKLLELDVVKKFVGNNGSSEIKSDKKQYVSDCDVLPCCSLVFESASSSSESEDDIFLPTKNNNNSVSDNQLHNMESSPNVSEVKFSSQTEADSGYISQHTSSLEPSIIETNTTKDNHSLINCASTERDVIKSETSESSIVSNCTTPVKHASLLRAASATEYHVSDKLRKSSLKLIAKKQCAEDVDSFLSKVIPYLKPKSPKSMIGWKIGEENIDIISNLNDMDAYPVLNKICGYLSSRELRNFCKVSESWKKVYINHYRCRNRRLRSSVDFCIPSECKENVHKSPKKLERGLSDAKEGPLRSLQTAATPVAPKQLPEPLSRSQAYNQVASTLRMGESLRRCPLCSSPAKISAVEERASCVSTCCQYDFCIKCRKPFHGAEPCKEAISKKTKTEASVGTKKSKKNLRRL